MGKLQFGELSALQPLPLIQILSVDWSIYQVRVTSEDGVQLLYKGDEPACFSSLGQIKNLFQALQVGRYELIRHSSSYDEMIGQPEVVFSDLFQQELFWKQVEDDPSV